MKDQERTKPATAQLLLEVDELRQRVVELEASASQCQAKLRYEAQCRASELAAIHRTGQHLQKLRPLAELAQAIIAVLEETFAYEYCAVQLLEEATGRLLPFALSEQGRGPEYVAADEVHVLPPGSRLGVGITGWVAQHGQSVRVGDVTRDPRYLEVRKDIRSELCVPMRSGDQVLGVVNIETVRPNAYTEADQRVLETVAAQLAVAVQNARLYEELQVHTERLEQRVIERTTELSEVNESLCQEVAERSRVEAEIRQQLDTATLLHRLSGLIASASDMEQALHRVCAELAGFLRVPQAGFALLNPERSNAEVIADVHPPESPSAIGTKIPVADNPSMAYVLEKSAPLAVSKAQVDPRLSPVHDLMRRRKVESILIVPLIVDGEVIGTLGFDAFEPRIFGESDIRLVQHVANQVGQLLLRKRAEAALERRAREMELLYLTSLEIGAQLELSTLLGAIVHRATELVGVDIGALYLTEPDGNNLELVVAHNLPAEYVGIRLGIGEGLPGRVAETGQPLVVEDYRNWEGRAAVFDRNPARRVLGVPLRIRDRVIGVLDLTDVEEAGQFDAGQVRLASLFADQAAIAVENARLLDAERTAREQTEALRVAAHAIGTSLAPHEILRKILDQLRRVLVYDSASVLVLRDGHGPDLIVGLGYEDEEATSRDAGRLLQSSPILRQMALDLQPVVSPDVRQLEGWIWVPGAEHVCSWMGIPLVAHGRMIGVLMVDHSDAGRYGQAELRLAAALAQHTAQAMENARLFEEMQILKAFNENIVRGIAEGILVEDAEGCITFVNPAMEAMLGYTGEELVGRHWATMIADDQSSFVGRHAVAGSEGVEGRYETTLLSKGGRRVPVMVSARPVLERGQVTGVLSAFTDISERVKAERAVEERRRYLEAVLTSVPDAIVTLDKQHRVVEWNPGAEVLFGYSPEETIGRELDSLVTAADTFEEATAITRRVMAGEDVPPTETVRYRQDGSPVAVTLAGSPILVGGEMTGIVGVYTDISERKEAERALVDSESRLSGILSSMVDLVFAFDREGRFTFYHAPSSDDLYVAPSEFLGQTHGRVMPAHIDELFAQAFEANREGRAARYEYWIDIGGQTRWFSVNLSPSFLQGEFRGSVAVARDITERTQAEEALRKANRGLRMLSECNAVLSRVREEPDLLHQVCQIAVEIGGYRMAWVGVPEQDEAKTVRPVAKAGFEDGYLDQVGISWADNERGRGPTGTAVRTHRPASAWNLITDPDYAPWREEAIRRGYASSVSLPLMTDGRCLGALSIFSSEPETFDPDEVSLLTELADNLAFGMAALRTRAERAWMEGVLQRYAERMEMLQEVGRAILEAQSPEAIAQATLARIGHLVPCQRASILAFGPEKTPRALAVRLSEGGTVGEAEPQDRKLGPEQQRSRDRISIPLMAQGELVGILRLTSFRPHAFSPEHIEIAYQVAAPLAVAIQHARLNEQLRTHAGSLEETVAQRTRELKAERDRTQAILESLGEAVMVTDSEGMILYANPATTALTGFPSEELLGQSWRLLQGDRQGDDVFEQAQEAMRAGQAWRSETSGRRPDDTQYDAAVTATPLFGSDHVDQVIGSVWVQRDITPLKEAERLKDQFISNVSHELRTPLSIITLIIGNLDRLYCRLEDDRRHQMIQSVREHVGVLNDLVGDVLEISRIDSGRISLERKDVDLAQLVREEMAKQQPLAARKLQRLEVIGASSLTFQGNEGQLRQILRNLLNNAIKFTPAGGDITCACRRGMGGQDWGPEWPGSAGLPAGFWAALFVMDNGVGIRRDDLPQLFERFYRVEAQGDIPGTGLGLAIARELVELHNGHIAVDSTLGEGSVFAVYLPLEGEDG